MRRAVRKYRAAKGRVGPRRRFKAGDVKKRYPKKGSGKGGRRRGFFLANAFAPLDHIPDDPTQAYFKGKFARRSGKALRDQQCYKCGRFGHWAKECPEPEEVCNICHKFGHRKADWPARHGRQDPTSTVPSLTVAYDAGRAAAQDDWNLSGT